MNIGLFIIFTIHVKKHTIVNMFSQKASTPIVSLRLPRARAKGSCGLGLPPGARAELWTMLNSAGVTKNDEREQLFTLCGAVSIPNHVYIAVIATKRYHYTQLDSGYIFPSISLLV